MDIEKRLEALTLNLELQSAMQADAEARHNREMAEIRASQAKTESVLRRAVRLGVREARAERERREESDRRLTQRLEELAQRQKDLSDFADQRHQELENLMKRFFERGGNGQH
jgi:hypothetical protein